MSKDPSVNVYTVDESIVSSIVNVDLGLKILVPIYSKTGTTDIQIIKSQDEFLREYSQYQTLQPDDHESMFYAFRLLSFGVIYVKRVGKQYLYPGMSSLGEKLIINDLGELQDTTELTISRKVVQDKNFWVATETTCYYVGEDVDLPIGLFKVQVSTEVNLDVLVNNLVYYASPAIIQSKNSHVQSLIEIKQFSPNIANVEISTSVGKYKYISNGDGKLSSGDYLSFGGRDYFLQSDTQFVPAGLANPIPIKDALFSGNMDSIEFMQRILKESNNGIDNLIAIKYNFADSPTLSTNMRGISIDASSIDFILNIVETKPHLVIGDSVYYCGEVVPDGVVGTPVQLSRANSVYTNDFFVLLRDYNLRNAEVIKMSVDATSLISFIIYSGIGSSTNRTTAITITSDPTIETYNYTFPKNAENANLVKYSDLYASIDKFVYYNVDAPIDIPEGSILVKVSSSPLGIREFIQKVQYQALSTFDCNLVEGNLNFISDITSEFNSTHFDVKTTKKTYQSDAKFAIVQRFSSDDSDMSFSYEKLDDDLYRITTKYNAVVNTITVGFDPSMVDDAGSSIYFENGKYRNKYYKIVEIKDKEAVELDTFQSEKFGDSIGQSIFNPRLITDAISETLITKEDVYWDLISDGGVSDINMTQSLATFARDYKYQYFPSIPAHYNLSEVQSYVKSLGLNNPWCAYTVAGHRLSVSGISHVFSGSILSVIKFVQNASDFALAFVSPFGKSKGSVPVDDPIQFWGTDERKDLLKLNINILKKDAESGYFLATAYTSQDASSQLSFIQNVRMTGVISRIADIFMESYLAESNTDVIRLEVENKLTAQLQNSLLGGRKNEPKEIKVKCNDENNPIEVQARRELVVDIDVMFFGTIVTINVYNRIKPLA